MLVNFKKKDSYYLLCCPKCRGSSYKSTLHLGAKSSLGARVGPRPKAKPWRKKKGRLAIQPG